MTDEFIPPRLEMLFTLPRANLCPGDLASSLQLVSRGKPPSCQWDPVVLPCMSYKPCLGLRACVWEPLAWTFRTGQT